MAGKDVPVSPLAPKVFAGLPAIDGVTFATAEAGIRYKGRTDVLMALLAPGTQAAGVFTTSKCPSAAVDWCRTALKGGSARALVVNSGNANAFTGVKGKAAVRHPLASADHGTSASDATMEMASSVCGRRSISRKTI